MENVEPAAMESCSVSRLQVLRSVGARSNMTSAGTIKQTLAIANITGQALMTMPDPCASSADITQWLGTFIKLAYHKGACDALLVVAPERR